MGTPLTHPLTRYLRKQGKTLKFYAESKGWGYEMLKQVITGNRASKYIEEGLKEDGLYDLLPSRVRRRLEELHKEGKREQS